MKCKYFGTDGIRGSVANGEMTPEFFRKIGAGLGRYLRIRHPKGAVHVVVGRDTRESGKALEEAFIEGIKPYGVDLDLMGVIPTPAVSFWIEELEADNGVAITASHNPFSDNGIKFFNVRGRKQPKDKEAMIDRLIDEEGGPEEAYAPGEIIEHENAIEGYLKHVKELMPKAALAGWKVVLDTANGAAYKTSREFFDYLGATVIHLGGAPDGRNINAGVGAECPEVLVAAVKEHGAHIGIAHDGDGDRLVVVDEAGQVVLGEQLLGIFALHAHKQKRLKNNLLVTTVQSNSALDQVLKENGISVIRTEVGDRNVVYAMREHKAMVGGEPSGHFVFRDCAQTGDGLIAAVKVIEVMLESGERLTNLRKAFPLFPQRTADLVVQRKVPLEELVLFNQAIAEVKASLGDAGRVLVRYSGTQNKLRLLVEARQEADAENYMKHLKEVAASEIATMVAKAC